MSQVQQKYNATRYNSSTLEYGAFPMLFFGLDYAKIRK